MVRPGVTRKYRCAPRLGVVTVRVPGHGRPSRAARVFPASAGDVQVQADEAAGLAADADAVAPGPADPGGGVGPATQASAAGGGTAAAGRQREHRQAAPGQVEGWSTSGQQTHAYSWSAPQSRQWNRLNRSSS